MYLYELFADSNDNGDDDVIHSLRQEMMDMLMPLAARGVPFVTIDSVIDEMKNLRTGMSVDRAIVMQVLDPQEVKMVKKIEGDRIYFSVSSDDNRKVGDDQKKRDQDHVANQAAAQAKKNIQQ